MGGIFAHVLPTALVVRCIVVLVVCEVCGVMIDS